MQKSGVKLSAKAVKAVKQMSLVMRKPDFCLCENKDADQLHGNREADQRLCFRYTDSTITLLFKSKISSLWPSSVTVQPGLCRTWLETPKTGFFLERGSNVRQMFIIPGKRKPAFCICESNDAEPCSLSVPQFYFVA